MQKVIEHFRDEHAFLSNFYPASVTLDGQVYPSVEHAYQAAKTLDRSERKPFKTGSAMAAKRRGRELQLRADWENVKIDIMYSLLQQKFQRTELKEKLLATGTSRLVEGNTWHDSFWGVYQGKGENYLGRLLMKVRDELCTDSQNAKNRS